jgi:hypothetical protein
VPSRARAGLRGIRREGKRAALGVTTDSPALTWMNHRTAEVLNALKRGGKINHREVRQRGGVTGTLSTLMQSQTKVAAIDFPACPSVAGPRRELGAEYAAPEPPSTLRIVGGELNQWGRHGL